MQDENAPTNLFRRALGDSGAGRSTDRIRWEEGEAPMDQQYPEPTAPTGIQVATSSNIYAVNVCVTMFWWIWENWCGFTGYLSRQNAFGDMGLRFTAYMMGVTDIFEAFFSMIMRIVRLFWQLIMWLWRTLFRIVYAFGIPLPIVFWYLIGMLLLYLLNAYWQLILVVVIDVVVPILNLLIVILNFLTLLITLLLRIVFQIWNIFVPFIGMIIYVLIDLVVTVLQIVFDILQSDGLMNILQALFEIIFFIVDIAMQILMVFLQLGMPILQILAELLSFILELIFTVIEIVLEILVWILDLLFKILEPILLIVQALCAAFSWMAASSFAGFGRSLLSTSMPYNRFTGPTTTGELSGQPMHKFVAQGHHNDYMDFVSAIYSQYARHVVYNSTSPAFVGDSRLDPDSWFAQSMRARKEGTEQTPLDGIKRDLALRAAAASGKAEVPEGFGTGRRLFEARRLVERSAVGVGLEDDNHATPEEEASKVDKTSEVFMSQFHHGVRKMVAEPTTNLDLMHHTLGRVRDHQRRGRDDIAIQSIMQRVAHEHPELAGAPPGPAWVRYQKDVEHPQETHIRLQNERHTFADSHDIPRTHRAYLEKVAAEKKIVNPAGQRGLLNAPPRTWLDDGQHMAASHLRNLEIQHAQQIRDQHEEYTAHHYNRVLATKTVFHGTRERMLYHAQNTLHFDNFSYHAQNILERHGYKSVKEAYHDFLKTHASAENFVLTLSYLSELPGISFLKQYDERRDSHPFFHDWHQAMQEEDALREKAGMAPKHSAASRKLMRTQPTQEDAEFAASQQTKEPAGRGSSKEKFEGLEIISKTDCFSVPRNPLCMPEIPADLGEKLQIGKITIDDRFKDDSDLCDPWMPDSNPIGWVRIVNGYHSIRFLISGFPPLNYLLTTFTLLVPWLAWTVDWVFLVPKGSVPGFAKIFCFFISIYDLIIFILFIRFVWWCLKFISVVFGKFVGDLYTAKQRQYEFNEKIVQQRTTDPLLEQQFRAYTLLEKEREMLDQADNNELTRSERDRLAREVGVTVNQQLIQFNLNGNFDHTHPYSQHHVQHIRRVTESVQSEERYRELFAYFSALLQTAMQLDERGRTEVNQNAVLSSWRRICKKYPHEHHDLPLDGVIIEHGAEEEAASSNSGQPFLLPYLHSDGHDEKNE